MKDKKILYISSEVVPYLPHSELSNLGFEIPKMVNDRGGHTRIFIPKYGLINERRHQANFNLWSVGLAATLSPQALVLAFRRHP